MEELMLISNPYYQNPRKKRKSGGKRMRNPISAGAIGKEWFQGVNFMDAGAAVGGLAASTMLPGLIVKDTATGLNKFLKILASLGFTAVAGFALRNISPSAGKAAIIGGLAGTATQAIGMFTNIQIGRPMSRQLGSGYARRIGQSMVPEMAPVHVS